MVEILPRKSPNANRLRRSVSTSGGWRSVSRLVAITLRLHPSHCQRLSASSFSVAVKCLSALSIDVTLRASSSARSMHGSCLFDVNPQDAQRTWLRRKPPNTRNTCDVQASGVLSRTRCARSTAWCSVSTKHRVNSCASSCACGRNWRPTTLRRLRMPLGATTLPLPCRTMPTSLANCRATSAGPKRVCSSLNLAVSSRENSCDSGGVYSRHWSTEFM
mmetsp:Transcript_7139/g.22564  ORF Transcript_7139/g.22564 Transcript_7139/m.22564 type:complete len:218 (-) Transcript_7139:536-1189(-)